MNDHRQQAAQIAQEMLQRQPIFLDTETTGFENNDEVIEVAVIDHDGQVLLDTLVKPRKSIPSGATAVHGITDANVAFSPPWGEVWPQLVEVLEGRVLGIYNAKFDLRLLRQTCGLNGIAWEPPFADQFCVMELFAQFYGEWNPRHRNYRWKSLEFAGKHLGLPEPNAHRAKADTILARLVLHKIAGEVGE
ncbi:exonuclease domain-containing protein [Chloroflexota bacterium]